MIRANLAKLETVSDFSKGNAEAPTSNNFQSDPMPKPNSPSSKPQGATTYPTNPTKSPTTPSKSKEAEPKPNKSATGLTTISFFSIHLLYKKNH